MRTACLSLLLALAACDAGEGASSPSDELAPRELVQLTLPASDLATFGDVYKICAQADPSLVIKTSWILLDIGDPNMSGDEHYFVDYSFRAEMEGDAALCWSEVLAQLGAE